MSEACDQSGPPPTEPRDTSRRAQIVAAALELLGDVPLDRLTTRDIAAVVGVSQPALFRHFRSREALLLAVVDAAREDLGRVVQQVLAHHPEPLAACLALARALGRYTDTHPGLPRLLFADVTEQVPEVQAALSQLVGMQRGLVAERVAAGQERGTVRPDVDPEAAGTLFVGMIQGLVLQARMEGTGSLSSRLEAVLPLWQAAVAPAMAPQPVETTPPSPPPTSVAAGRAVALDVRPILAGGVDPLGEILRTLASLPPGSLLVVTAPFRPRPLEALLQGRGHTVTAQPGPHGTWDLVVVVGGQPQLLDLRDLEPPEPLERVLTLASQLPAGGTLLAHLPRHPRWLLPQLDARGLQHAVLELGDGTAILRAHR